MLDGILLEQRGIPTAVICTDLFVPNGRATAKAHGAPDYPFALVPHPMASASPVELARQAKEVLPEVLRLLVAK
ncbi:MAG: hypothetical protein HYT85_14815 [candidate division NC10 bacterium]|nr:hypothetical protein [candidate division NC10 bacterium]MBI2116340.1 hypothetical protein [candidate division NC10 bacterium]MBI3085086.1 hypothetical protein [candidate division NC10 bacterium]